MTISVLINTWNHERFIGGCLDSVFGQTRRPDEVVVVDDGSTDGTLALLRSRPERFTLIESPQTAVRKGAENQARAIDAAFRQSTGELVFLLDGDDAFLPEKIARYAPVMEREPRPVLVQAPVIQIDGDGRRQPYQLESFRQARDPLAAVYARRDADLFFPTSALACTREFLARTLPLDCTDGLELWGDVRLTTAALFAGPVVTLPEPLTLWRRHSGSSTLRDDASRRRLVELTWQRTKLFNRLASAADRPGISVWRNRRFYRQLARWLLPWPGNRLARWLARNRQNGSTSATGVAGPS